MLLTPKYNNITLLICTHFEPSGTGHATVSQRQWYPLTNCLLSNMDNISSLSSTTNLPPSYCIKKSAWGTNMSNSQNYVCQYSVSLSIELECTQMMCLKFECRADSNCTQKLVQLQCQTTAGFFEESYQIILRESQKFARPWDFGNKELTSGCRQWNRTTSPRDLAAWHAPQHQHHSLYSTRCPAPNRTATNLCIVAEFRPLKAETKRLRFTEGGNQINYQGNASTPNANLTTVKLLLINVLSMPNACFVTGD